MKVWFGSFEEGNWKLSGKRPEQLAAYAGSLDSSALRKDIVLASLAIDAGLCSTAEEYQVLLHETALSLARERVAALTSGEDVDVVQAIRALDTAIDAYNEMTERLTEWYGMHNPDARVKPQELIDLIEAERPEALEDLPQLDDYDSALRGYATMARALLDERKRLEGYISRLMEDVAPNLSELLGPLLGARLIARAGGLEKLARLPGSTIQVMGAGEALFKHLREGTPPPKHGYLYRHPLISGSPKRMRGKLSRMLASKAAIAARVDYYSGRRLPIAKEARERARAIRKLPREGRDGS